jgi:hypothetical protein
MGVSNNLEISVERRHNTSDCDEVNCEVLKTNILQERYFIPRWI